MTNDDFLQPPQNSAPTDTNKALNNSMIQIMKETPTFPTMVVKIGLRHTALGTALEYFKEKNANGLSISDGYKLLGEEFKFDKSTSITEIAQLFPNIKHLAFRAFYIDDWTDLDKFSRLKSLWFSSEPDWVRKKTKQVENKAYLYPNADLSHYPELDVFGTSTLKGIKNLEKSPISQLHLYGEIRRLDNILFPHSLRKISLRAVNSLEGISNAPHLTDLELRVVGGLTDMSPLKDNLKLETLKIRGCSKIDYATFPFLPSLKRLQIEFESNGKLQSLDFLKNVPNLEGLLIIGTTIVDGDLSPILNLPNLKKCWFQDKKAYSQTLEQILNVKKAQPIDSTDVW